VAGAGEGRKRPNRPTNCHKGTILRTATKALFGALVGGAFLKIRCSVCMACTDVITDTKTMAMAILIGFGFPASGTLLYPSRARRRSCDDPHDEASASDVRFQTQPAGVEFNDGS
jgi:hypothetical protein